MQLTKCLTSLQLGMKGYSKLNLDFLLKKLSCTSEDIFTLVEEGHEIPPFAAKFCSVQGQKHILAISSEVGDVLLLDTNHKAKTSLIKQWKAHYNAIFDICWLNGESKLITSSSDRTAILWDLINWEKITVFKGHRSSVKNICSRPNSQCIFATASRDGSIKIWDTRCNRSCNDISCGAEMTIRDAHNAASVIPGTPKQRKKKEIYSTSGNPLHSVTSIEFQNENLLFSSGTADGVVKVWDLRRNYSASKKEAVPYVKFPYKGNSTKAHGFTSLAFNDSSSVLYANCTDSVIYAYNSSSYSPVPLATYHGHKTSTFFVKMVISNDNEYLLSGSSDNHAYIWKISQPGHPLLRLMGHQAEVTAVAWNPIDITKVVTCSDDVQIIFWNVKENVSETPWKYDNKVLGKAEVISDTHSPQEIASKRESCLYNFQQDIQSRAVYHSSPQTPNFRNSPSSCLSSPDITRWFKPSPTSVTNYRINSIIPNSSTKHNNSYMKRDMAPHGKKRTLLHFADKTPKSILLGKTPDEERENHRLVTPKVVSTPDECRVLSPKKLESDINLRNLQTVRRSLDMDSAMTHNSSTSNISCESNSYKDQYNWKKCMECKTERANSGRDNGTRSKVRKTSNQQRSEDKSSKLCINKVSSCSGQMAPITSYFISAAEDTESATGHTK